MLISIKGLSKIDVLLALYDNVTFDRINSTSAPSMSIRILKTLMRKRSNGSRKEAEALLKNQTFFDYVDLGAGKRQLQVNLASFELESFGYDRAYGEGQAAKVIHELRQASIQDRGADLKARQDQGHPLLWRKDLAKHQNLNFKEIEKNIEERNLIVKPIKSAL